MPRVGEYVTVRALVTMPGIGEGEIAVLEWTPQLARLVRMSRYEVVEPEAPPEEPPPDDPPAEPPPEGSPPDSEGLAAGDEPRPARTNRRRR